MAAAPEFLCSRCGEWVEHKNETCGRCRADLFPRDTFLRLAGFVVAHRPKGARSIWRDKQRGGEYVFDDAMAIASARQGT